MTTLLFLALVGLVAGWLNRERALRRALAELQQRQTRLEVALSQLQTSPTIAPAQSPGAPVSPPPPVPPRLPDQPQVVPQPLPPPGPLLPQLEASAEPERAPSPPPLATAATAFDWEQFVGVKLVAWLAGLALFLAAALGLKYSFEQNLIPPALRAGAGFILGGGLLFVGVVLKRREYVVTAQTLAATGVVILYAVTFACRSLYHFAAFGPALTFSLMAGVTAVAFGLAVRMTAQVIAVLGLLGGFLTPILVGTGEDNPGGLFGYLAILDLGLLAVVWRMRWNYLSLCAALGTIALQGGWFMKFYTPEKLGVLQLILPGFAGLFLAAYALFGRRDGLNRLQLAATALLPLTTLGMSFALVSSPELAALPGRVFLIVFAADLALLTLVALQPAVRLLETLGGGALFLLLGSWTSMQVQSALLPWALGLTFGFALLHTAFPVLLRRLRPGAPDPEPVWAQFFPALALLLVLIPLVKALPSGPWFWTVIVLVDALAVGVALLSGALLGLIAVIVLTFALAGVWLNSSVHELADTMESLGVIGGFGIFLAAAGAFTARRLGFTAPGTSPADPRLRAAVPALSASLPFLLLIMLVQRLHPANPTAIFAVAAGLGVGLLALARGTGFTSLAAIGLGAVGLLQWVWLVTAFRPELGAAGPLSWHAGFAALFTVFPFMFTRHFAERRLPWAVAALAGVVHFPFAYLVVKQTLPTVPLGLVPAVFALPAGAGLVWLARRLPQASPGRLTPLAWFAGVGLFFVTLIFPVQFDRQWITLGWALEGWALCWLFHRLPHPGLRATGVGLLLAAFARLAFNPAVLGYHPHSATPIFNWYLYTYGLVTVALFGAARLLAPPREKVLGSNVLPLLYTLGTALAFWLVNLEIADYFATGDTLVLEFSGNFARDLTYTIAWSLFALGLIFAGVAKRVKSVRYAGLALLGVVVLKLFFHDLARLSQLYRIIAFAAVAVIALAASLLYQRFLADTADRGPERPS